MSLNARIAATIENNSPANEVEPNPIVELTNAELAATIDHTLLQPTGNRAEITRLCAQAREYGFASVCVNPVWVPFCAHHLQGSAVPVCSVIGFPLGASGIDLKACEARWAVAQGAREVDMVLHIGALLEGDYQAVAEEIHQVVLAAHPWPVKVIIEACLLLREQKIAACVISQEQGAKFVKSSTGFSKGGAAVEDIRLMRKIVGPDMGVKASGGIRDRRTALAMIAAGANRIGASAGIHILSESSVC